MSAEPQPCSPQSLEAARRALEKWKPPFCPQSPAPELCIEIAGYTVATATLCGTRIQVATGPSGGEAEESPAWARLAAAAQLPPPFIGDTLAQPPTPTETVVTHAGYTGLTIAWRTSRGPAALRVRRRAADSPAEPVVMAYLTEAGFPWAPRLYSYTLLEDEAYTLYREWVPGRPLAELPEEALWQALRSLGRALMGLHTTLASCPDPLCAPEPSEPGDVERWLYRLEYRIGVLQRLAGDGLAEALEALERLTEEAGPLAEAAAGFDKQRIHGDPHLYNAIYSGGEVFLVDYSGEPHREPAGLLEKEPPQRDVAVALRSLDYLAQLRGREDILARGAVMLLEGYGGCRGRLGAQATAFWLLERASYELFYELTTRTGLEHVPAAALKRMASGRDGLYRILALGKCPGRVGLG